MIAGRLNEIITVEKLQVTKNEYGEEQTDNFIFKFNTRAEVKYNSGSRTNDNNELFFSYDLTFTVRIYNDIDELDRIVWNGNRYRILSTERNRQFQLINIRGELINE